MPKSKHLDTLLELKDDPSLSQRSLAHKLNISLGLTNSILQNLIHRGLIKAQKMTGRKILYLITPKGMVQNLYNKGVRKVVIYGTGQLAEITYLSLLDSPLKLHSILTDDPASSKKKFLGHEVLTLSGFAQKISQTPVPENLIILSTVSQEKDEKGKDKTQSLETEIKKYNNLFKKIKIINLESILKNVKG